MNAQPAVSLIVPVYNTEKYLPETMRSLCAQTLEDLEIICIDDCSTDASLNIMRDFAARDPRVRVIANSQNVGATLSRKRGVCQCRGEFVMFADGDDLLLPECCERALELIRRNPCDILQFNVKRLVDGVLSESNRTLTPYPGRIERSPLIEPWLCELKFCHTIWGKIYRKELCRRAVEQIPDTPFTCALEDYYMFFIIGFFARSYYGVPEEKLYIYREGVGIAKNVELVLRSVKFLPALADFLRRQNALETHKKMLNLVAWRLRENAVSTLLATRKLEPAMFKEAVRCWGAQILYDFIVRLGVFNVETKDRNYILPRLINTLTKLRAKLNPPPGTESVAAPKDSGINRGR